MRAAVLPGPGHRPVVREIDGPTPLDGAVTIHVETAGLGGWDILGMYRESAEFPSVVRGEGVGRTDDGRRVYFGERSLLPFGAWAETTIVPAAEVWDVPTDIDDATAIALAIAGTGALVPLEQAAIQPGEHVLVLGATGTVGQIGMQLARRLGAGRVVGAARDKVALDRVVELGIADTTVRLGSDDDTAALRAEAGDGFDVVLDIIYGEPFVAALRATCVGARLMSIGVQAGLSAQIALPDLLFRTHTCVGTGQRPPHDRQAIWRRLLDMARQEPFAIETSEFTLESAPDAWTTQAAGPHAKVLGRIN